MGENDSLDSPAIVRRHVGRIAVVTGGVHPENMVLDDQFPQRLPHCYANGCA